MPIGAKSIPHFPPSPRLRVPPGFFGAEAQLQTSKRAEAQLQTSKRAEAQLQTSKRAEAQLQTSKRAEAQLQTSKRAEAQLQTSKRAEAQLQTRSAQSRRGFAVSGCLSFLFLLKAGGFFKFFKH